MVNQKDIFFLWLREACLYVSSNENTCSLEYRLRNASGVSNIKNLEIRIFIEAGRAIECDAYLVDRSRSVSWDYTWKDIKTHGLRGFLDSIRANVSNI